MTVIFKVWIEETFNRVSELINKNKVLVRFVSFAVIAVTALVVSVVSCGITVGFNVKYSDKNIAIVSSKSVFEKAKTIVLNSIDNSEVQNAIDRPKYGFTITTEDSLCNAETLADTIIENTDGVSFASALTVNGEVTAYAERDELKEVIDVALCKYYVENADNSSAFVDDVEITDAYCLEEQIELSDEIKATVADLKVKTVSTVTTETDIKYSTKTVYTSKETRGYEKVKTKGENGIKSETAVVETVNGKETTKTVVARKVLKEAVQKVVVKGTATPIATATAKAKAKSAGFIRPMNNSDMKLITAYWGDGRGHEGIDLAGDTGSPIFASKSGTVVSSGWDGNYGYAVVIDHGNGYKTRYAHCSALCVKKGDTVEQGQQIAKLGNTGRSTGPHLHFEILKNGSQINPAPYIGY